MPTAEKFEKWVFDEVLPSIRKTGQYSQQKSMTLPEQIQLVAQGYVELRQEVQTIKEDFQEFKNDMPILGIEEEKISNVVKKKGLKILGGKNSNAYNNKSIRGRLYSDIYKELKRQFDVNSYKAIKRSEADRAISLIKEYKPPFALSQTIETENAQQNLDL